MTNPKTLVNTRKKWVLVALLGLSLAGELQAKDSLCQNDEETVFSCSTGKKTVSLCASPELTSSTGYIQYRFGTKSHIELSYPAFDQSPREVFKYGHKGQFSWGFSYVKFSLNNFDYRVYDGEGRGWWRAGVVVMQNSTVVSQYTCKDIRPYSWHAVHTSKLPEISNTSAEDDMLPF
jgi:hypothetical protein